MYTIEYDLEKITTFDELMEIIEKVTEENMDYPYYVIASMDYIPKGSCKYGYEVILEDPKYKALKVIGIKCEPTIVFSEVIKGVEVHPLPEISPTESFKHFKYSSYLEGDILTSSPTPIKVPPIMAFERKEDNE